MTMAESKLPNFAACCRLCLADGLVNSKSIFDDEADDRALQQKISAAVGVEIKADDKLTTIVCKPCVVKITKWYDYRQHCSENQIKLEQWLTHSEVGDVSIQIKEEPVEHDSSATEVNGDVAVVKMEEEYELPPPLTPHSSGDVSLSSPSKDLGSNPRKCTVCGKVFSSTGNRKKHEKIFHDISSNESATESDADVVSQDERSQSSCDSQILSEPKEPTAEEKKILFAAGLKLLQRNSTPPISLEILSKIENSYIEKCKAMVQMYRTLQCACHNVSHPNLKGLLSHLRSLRIWFPIFTCYHCMITFTDRSASTKHYLRCPRSNLETLVKLSNLKKRSEVKTRLYQNYKCTQCRFMYTFHEDFCIHVDEDHSDIVLPYKCTCGRVFTSLEDYKDHAYISCLVEFYCDICFVTVKTLDAFQKHAAELHDNSPGFVLLQDDNYKQRKFSPPARIRNSNKREHADETNIVNGKRRTSYKPSIIEPDFDDDDEGSMYGKGTKVLNPALLQKIPGTTCPICLREYSTNNNMWRHYKTHVQDTTVQHDSTFDDSLYCCPDCGGMFSTVEWEKHKEMHKKKSCSECGKVFQFQSELDQHRSVHLNLKLYRDSKTQNYKSTMAMSPTGENNIVLMCEVCDRMFTNKEQLKEHKLTHDNMPILESAEVTLVDVKPKKFACKLCDKQYAFYGGLWDHNRKKHPDMRGVLSGDIPKRCKYCHKVFSTAHAYATHVQLHEQNSEEMTNANNEEDLNNDDTESYHTCKRCFKVFSTRSNLKSHMKSHGIITGPATKNVKKIGKKVWCDICHSAFENAATLDRHKNEEHSDNEDCMPNLSDDQSEGDLKAPFVFTCDICVQTFTTKIALKKHKEKHAKEMPPAIKHHQSAVYCKYCKISFETSQQLAMHMADEHDIEPPGKGKSRTRPYTCHPCKKSFTTAQGLYGHQGWHNRGKIPDNPLEEPLVKIKEEPDAEVTRFKCPTCNAVLPNDTALQIHILERHRNVNATVLPARCTMCNLDFGSQDEYEQHRKFHAMVEKQYHKSFPCNYCSAGFSRVDTLKAHVRQLHKEQIKTEYKCHHCERLFDKQASLNIHLKVHEKQKMSSSASKPLFSCSICNMGFDLPKDLRAHTIQAHPF